MEKSHNKEELKELYEFIFFVWNQSKLKTLKGCIRVQWIKLLHVSSFFLHWMVVFIHLSRLSGCSLHT